MRIQLVFISKPQWEAGWPYLGYDNQETIDKIRNHLKDRFQDIDFVQSEIITTHDDAVVSKIKEGIQGADGVILYTIGHYGDPGLLEAGLEILKMGKLTILANAIYGGDHAFTQIYAHVKDLPLPVYPVSSRVIEDIDAPLEVLIGLSRMRDKKILVYAADTAEFNWDVIGKLIGPEIKNIAEQYPEYIEQIQKMQKEKFEFYVDFAGKDQAHQWRRDEKKYKENLMKVFGIEMIRENPEEIMKYYNEVDDKDEEVIKIRDKWTNNAKRIEPSKKTILNSAKLYVAFKRLFEEKNVEIITPDCGTMLLIGKMPAYPCMPFFELTNEGKYGICESDLDSTISYFLGLHLTGRPGYVSNHTFDLTKNQITYMHCVAPNKLYGLDGPAADYEIVYHGETHMLGACPRVFFPKGEITTTIKVSMLKKKIAISQGTIIDNVDEKGGCVSKMLVETDANKIMENYDWDTFGWHRVTFLGDWLEHFTIASKFLGLELVVLDK